MALVLNIEIDGPVVVVTRTRPATGSELKKDPQAIDMVEVITIEFDERIAPRITVNRDLCAE